MVFLILDDLQAFDPDIDPVKAQAMINDASALAVFYAPGLADPDVPLSLPTQDALRAILRGAILRWNDSGTGALSAQTAGPFGQTLDTRQPRRGMFWPSEIEQLRGLLGGTSSDAFSVDTAPAGFGVTHADICSINFGAAYCSCGAVLTQGLPLYENL